jgi:hypothetical protein
MITFGIVIGVIILTALVGWLFSDNDRPTAYREPKMPKSLQIWIPPDINDPPERPPLPEKKQGPYIPEFWNDYDRGLVKVGKLGKDRSLIDEADELDEWLRQVMQTAFVTYGGRLSPKMVLFPHFRTSAYDHIPYRWRSLRFFERLSVLLRAAGYAEVLTDQTGLRLTDKGIEYFEADPDRWYP